jgi:hypothetical protein
MPEPQAGRRVALVRCDEVQVGKVSEVTRQLRFPRGEKDHQPGDGWQLSLDRFGIVAKRGKVELLVPWARVHTVEFEPEEVATPLKVAK